MSQTKRWVFEGVDGCGGHQISAGVGWRVSSAPLKQQEGLSEVRGQEAVIGAGHKQSIFLLRSVTKLEPIWCHQDRLK